MSETPIQFARGARRRILAYTPTGTFSEACALLSGYTIASDDELFSGFQQWLGQRHGGRSELAFWYHTLSEAFPGREPAIESLADDEHAIAVDVLFALLEACLEGADPSEYDLSL